MGSCLTDATLDDRSRRVVRISPLCCRPNACESNHRGTLTRWSHAYLHSRWPTQYIFRRHRQSRPSKNLQRADVGEATSSGASGARRSWALIPRSRPVRSRCITSYYVSSTGEHYRAITGSPRMLANGMEKRTWRRTIGTRPAYTDREPFPETDARFDTDTNRGSSTMWGWTDRPRHCDHRFDHCL